MESKEKKVENKPEDKPKDKAEDKTPEDKTSEKKPEEIKSSPLIEAARAEREALEKATASAKEERERQEKMIADQSLRGKGEAGGAVEKTEDEAWAERAKERYAGTGMDPTPDKEDK